MLTVYACERQGLLNLAGLQSSNKVMTGRCQGKQFNPVYLPSTSRPAWQRQLTKKRGGRFTLDNSIRKKSIICSVSASSFLGRPAAKASSLIRMIGDNTAFVCEAWQQSPLSACWWPWRPPLAPPCGAPMPAAWWMAAEHHLWPDYIKLKTKQNKTTARTTQ